MRIRGRVVERKSPLHETKSSRRRRGKNFFCLEIVAMNETCCFDRSNRVTIHSRDSNAWEGNAEKEAKKERERERNVAWHSLKSGTVFSAILVSKKLSLVRLVACRSPSLPPLRPSNPTASSLSLSLSRSLTHLESHTRCDTCTRSFHVHTRTRGHSSFRLYLFPLFFSILLLGPSLLFLSLIPLPLSYPPSVPPPFSLALSLRLRLSLSP